MNATEYVVLVDNNDNELGMMEKLEAHQRGLLHRAISVFVFNTSGEMLLHKRAASKYHSPNLWTNTCCSHPRPKETVADAATRRLREEMGMACELNPSIQFVYKADVGGGLTEYEYDHVFVGRTDESPIPNPDEVGEWKWMRVEEIREEMASYPERYTAWFMVVFERVVGAV